MGKTKIGVMGCAGRMGRMNLTVALENPQAEIVGGVEPAGSPALGRDLGGLIGADSLGLTVGDDADDLFAAADVVVEFSTPDASAEHAGLAARHKTCHLIGTTGLGPAHQAAIEAAAAETAILQAANTCLGINILQSLVEQAARALDTAYDIEVLEMHHRHKVDAPSGTALLLGEAAADGRQIDLAEHSVRSRDGHTGPREQGSIGFATLRGGSVVGDHTVVLAGEGERIELTHRAQDRTVFANGAVRAARWGQDKTPGLYTMADVLGLT